MKLRLKWFTTIELQNLIIFLAVLEFWLPIILAVCINCGYFLLVTIPMYFVIMTIAFNQSKYINIYLPKIEHKFKDKIIIGYYDGINGFIECTELELLAHNNELEYQKYLPEIEEYLNPWIELEKKYKDKL